MSQPEPLPINSVARNVAWAYDSYSPPHFSGAPVIVERTRGHRMPDFSKLPEAADIAVELYGGTVTLRLDGIDATHLQAARLRHVLHGRGGAPRLPRPVAGGRAAGL